MRCPLFRALPAVLLFFSCVAGTSAAEKMSVHYDASGLHALKVEGQDLLRSGRPHLQSVVLEVTEPDAKNQRKYQFEKVTEPPRQVSFDERTRRFQAAYSWGTLQVDYVDAADRLNMAVTFTNTSKQVLADFELTLLEVTFSATPVALKKGAGLLESSLDNVALVKVEDGKKSLLACNLSIDPPFRLGFGKALDPQKVAYPLVVLGGVPCPAPGDYHIDPHGLPRILPGKSLKLEVSLRAGAGDAEKLLADVRDKFRDFHSAPPQWKDRGPIGMIMHSSGFKGHVSKTNPRGWLSDPKLDVTTPAGKAEYRKRMLAAATTSVKVIKEMGGQGMILWDVEGQENPHPISYIGDPRLTKQLAPEMEEIADDYFKVYRDAGLRTGVCLRPSQVFYNESKKQWEHGTGSDGGPGRGDHYAALRPKDIPWWDFYPVVERLCDKIAYAKKRWGCTLFYIDSNGVQRQLGETQKFRWTLLNAALWKQVQEKHPDVLLIPELVKDEHAFHAATWAYAAPYQELDLQGYGTPERVRVLLPTAFSVINVSDGDIEKHRNALKAAVRQGDILLFRGWFDDKRNGTIKKLYQEAKEK